MPNQYVILHHRTKNSEHWDLMLEHKDVLLTWQLSAEPDGPSTLPLKAIQITDHRKAYLTYEGPISGERGEVRRVDEGHFEFEEITANEYVFEIEGRLLTGRMRLRCTDGQWWLEACPSE